MQQYISIVTLGVSDIAKATSFYEKLGWVNTRHSNADVSFLQGFNIVLGLYGHSALAEDVGLVAGGLPSFRGVTLALNLPSEKLVDEFFALAVSFGAHPQKQPQKVFWGGYSGYFADPDGHLWEVAHNPFFALDANNQINLLQGD